MPLTILNPQTSLFLNYWFGKRKTKVSYRIEATNKVHVYFVDEIGLNNYKRGLGFTTYANNRYASIHNEEIYLEYPGQWFLIIHNSNRNHVSVFYEVYEK